MGKLLARRLMQFPLVVAVIYTVTFVLIVTAPGDPLTGADTKLSAQTLKLLRAQYGLDKPWYVRYGDYAWNFASSATHGELNLGKSLYYSDKPVAEVMGLTAGTWHDGAMRTSLTLGLLSLGLAVLVGVNVGVWSAVRQNSLADHVALAATLVGVSLPTFVTGAMLIWLFALAIPILPGGGWGSVPTLVLPTLTLSLPFMAYIARLMRAGMLDVLNADYVRTARAKGLGERTVIYKHAFKLAFLPVLSYLGPAAAAILTGSFVVEQLFDVPGIGRHFVLSVMNRDQPLVIGTVLVYAVLLVSFNLLVDMAYMLVDPRISREEAV